MNIPNGDLISSVLAAITRPDSPIWSSSLDAIDPLQPLSDVISGLFFGTAARQALVGSRILTPITAEEKAAHAVQKTRAMKISLISFAVATIGVAGGVPFSFLACSIAVYAHKAFCDLAAAEKDTTRVEQYAVEQQLKGFGVTEFTAEKLGESKSSLNQADSAYTLIGKYLELSENKTSEEKPRRITAASLQYLIYMGASLVPQGRIVAAVASTAIAANGLFFSGESVANEQPA